MASLYVGGGFRLRNFLGGVTFRFRRGLLPGGTLDGNTVRGTRRVTRSAQSVDATRVRIKEWLAKHQDCPTFARFTNHFSVLEQVLQSMLDAIAGELEDIDRNDPSGSVYERCASLDRSLAIAVRLFEWYSAKYDQRLDKDTAPTLRAADEVVRSCWTEPFALLGRNPPTGPLVYLDADFDAFATPRVSVPRDLQGSAGSLIAGILSELPIPVIALPGLAASQAWWLVLAAHETGHHVQKDLLPGLEEATRERLVAAAAPTAEAASSADDLAARWAGWLHETFADAYSTLMVGAASVWAIDELQHATPASMCKLDPPGRGRYPPAAVRLALLGECLHSFGAQPRWPTAGDVRGWLDEMDDTDVLAVTRNAIRDQLATAPAAAAALIDLPIGTHRLRELGNVDPEVLTQPQLLRAWAAQLVKASPVLDSLDSPAAARLVIAAGVAAYQACADRPESEHVLPVVHHNLLTVLPNCGPPGVLEAPPRRADLNALAQRLAQRLLHETPDEEN